MLDLQIRIAPDGASVITLSAPIAGFASGGVVKPSDLSLVGEAGCTTYAKPRGLIANVSEGTVTDHRTGLMWSADDVMPKGCKHAAAIKACSELRLGGFSDWRLPTRAELLTLVDDTRHAPAIDTIAFPSCKSDWYWTSTIAAWSSDCAWIVDFYLGSAHHSHRGSLNGLVRAVRSVPAGQ